MEVSEAGRPQSPGVRFPPPLVYVLPFLVTYFLNQRIEFLIVGAGAGVIQVGAGTSMIIFGFLVMFWGLLTFARFRTAILPFRPARILVVEPPYTVSRNPMYLGLMLAYLGAMLATNWAWPLVFLPFVVLAMNAFVIAREEGYLRAEFGAAYDDYCRRVRRWL